MADQKTQPTDTHVTAYLDAIEHERKREDAYTLLALMQDVTGEPPVMWGESMIGFGKYYYRYASGHEGNSFLVGFAPRKSNFSVYIMAGFDEYQQLLDKLGKHKTGKACLYINKLADVDLEVLREMVRQSVDHMRRTNP